MWQSGGAHCGCAVVVPGMQAALAAENTWDATSLWRLGLLAEEHALFETIVRPSGGRFAPPPPRRFGYNRRALG